MENKKLDHTSELRDFWRCYDILQSTQRFYVQQIHDIYGGPDKYRRDILTGKLIVMYVQEEVGRILGALSMNIYDDTRNAHIGYLHVYLKGRGLGSNLLETAIQELQEKEIGEVSLRYRIDQKAYKFYLKHGFEDITTRSNQMRHLKKEL